jgi:hypothetical protein
MAHQNRRGNTRYPVALLVGAYRHPGSSLKSAQSRCCQHRTAVTPCQSNIRRGHNYKRSTAELIDRETGVRELADILENIITEAGDLIESRSPELAAQARAALRRYADEAPRQAE